MSEPNEKATLYAEHRNKAWEDIKSSTESFDRSLLTLSSGALALSLAFLKDLVPSGHAVWIRLLYASWIAFALCIAITLASFQVSIRAQNVYLKCLREFYKEGKEDSFDKHQKSIWYRALDWCTVSASLFFGVGLVCTVAFAIKNIGRNVQ